MKFWTRLMNWKDSKDSSWKDRASATLVTGIIGVSFILLVAGLAIDVSKNSWLKASFSSRAQQSVEIATKDMNARGGMKDTTPAVLVNTYLGVEEGGAFERDDTHIFQSEYCNTSQEVLRWDGTVGPATLPYIVIKMDTERAIGSASDLIYVSEGGGAPVQVSGTYNPAATYRVLSASITDANFNFFLGMAGMDCQKHTPRVSAIAFGSNEDID